MTLRSVLVMAALGVMAGRSDAEFITYTITTTGSGSLGGTAFTDAALVFTMTADTADVTGTTPGSTSSFMVANATATVSIAGLGLATFATPTATFFSFG